MALAGHDSFMKQYHDALVAEIEKFGTDVGLRLPIETIFFGGGTPSTYPDDLLLDMFGILKKVFILDNLKEVTLEVNPGTVRIPEQLAFWRDLGITRLSIGVQSLKDNVLKALNRHQSAQEVFALIEHASLYIDNISVDLILGLPEITDADWKELLALVVQWPIKHISLYFLTVHEDTPLYFKVQKKQVKLSGDVALVDLYHWSREFLAAHGFVQYEMSNFARQGYECKHNKVYWDRAPYKGFGLGACSFDGVGRFENDKKLLVYLEKASGGHDITAHSELLNRKQIILEHLMLGLRRAVGINLTELTALFTQEESDKFLEQVVILKQEKLLHEVDGSLMLTPIGLVVENEIVVRLL